MIVKTPKSCPIAQMYLEIGQWPARFELKKMRCLFLKQILKQDEKSQIFKFFSIQLNNPIKGDWVSSCLKDLSDLEIDKSIEEIKNMKRNEYKNIIKHSIEKKALEYLQSKRGSKGLEIKYTTLEMSEYLLPFNSKLNIDEKRKLFEIRNRMTKIPNNFGKEEKCVCGKFENMSHIYSCEILNKKKTKISFDEIYNGNLHNQIEIFRRIENNLEERRKMKTENNFPCDPSDPLDCEQSRFG